MAKAPPVLIVGAGIGGLAAAIAIAAKGREALLLERQHEFSTAGAGIQIGPNGMRVLQRLGAAETLRPLAGMPDRIEIYQAASARRLASMPLGARIAERHGAPYWTAHRADLQTALATTARASPRIEIEHGFEVAAVHQSGGTVTVMDRDGRLRKSDLLIGADGIGSVLRAAVTAPAEPSGLITRVARAVIPRERAGAPFDGGAVGLWLGADTHLVHYPVRGGDEIAFTFVSDQLTRASLPAVDLSPAVHAAFAQTGNANVWEIAPIAQIDRWTRGRIALIGDAAHPIMPYLAQGGVMALEDALVLADCIALLPEDIASALARFEAQRRARVDRVRRASALNGRLYHLGLPFASMRDAVLRSMPAARLIDGYDWLYGWRPPE